MRRMNHHRLIAPLAALLLGAAAVSAVAQPQDGSFGLELRKAATEQDVEMPLYPKAERVPEAGQETGAISLGVWSPGMGFRLAAIKFGSPDGVAQVAAFYREALARHGPVLECTAESGGKAERKTDRNTDRDRERLSCDDAPKPGSIVLKVGQRKDFRAVAIHPRASGSQFDLVRLRLRE